MTGLVSAYWRIVLSNNGEKNLSIVQSKVTQIPNSVSGAVYYSGLDQGMYKCGEKFVPIDISVTPIKLEPGDAETLCIKVGLLMDPQSYDLAMSKFGNEGIDDIMDLNKYLWSQGVDIYGNNIESIPGGFRFPILA